MNIWFKVEADVGCQVMDILRDMLHVACVLGCGVEAKINGVNVYVDGMAPITTVYEQYMSNFKEVNK